MQKFLEKIDKQDKKIEDYFKNHPDVDTKWLIDSLAINPVYASILILIVNVGFFQNKFFWELVITIFTWVGIMLFKQMIKRERPRPKRGKLVQEMIELETDNYSFPSAHTFATFELLPLTFAMFSWWAVILLVYAIFIAFSRIVLRFHYLSDVVVGGLLGLIIGGIIRFIFP